METMAYQVVECEAGVRQLDLRAVMVGTHRDRELRAAYLAGAYALADSLGMDTLPAELFQRAQQEADYAR